MAASSEAALTAFHSIACFLPSLPGLGRNCGLFFLHHAFNVLHRAPHSTIADTTGVVSSTLLPLRYKVMTSLCGLLVVNCAPGDGTHWEMRRWYNRHCLQQRLGQRARKPSLRGSSGKGVTSSLRGSSGKGVTSTLTSDSTS